MGRKTWDSIPKKFRPLRNRLNVVLTRNEDFAKEVPSSVLVAKSLSEALSEKTLKNALPEGQVLGDVFVIGGASVYKQAIASCHKLYLTRVRKQFECDTFFKFDSKAFELKSHSGILKDNDTPYEFLTFERRDDIKTSPLKKQKLAHEEYQYLELIKDIIDSGITRQDRTCVVFVPREFKSNHIRTQQVRVPVRFPSSVRPCDTVFATMSFPS